MTEGGRYKLSELEQSYYEWLLELAIAPTFRYTRLCEELYSIRFYAMNESDQNRASDGLSLRWRFAYLNHIPQEEYEGLKTGHPCSVLEVMVAMAVRCEEEFLATREDYAIPHLFYQMLENIGIQTMDDLRYSASVVRTQIHKTIERDYTPNGRGNFFYIPGYPGDLRTTELWLQMTAYVNYLGGNI